MSVPRRTLGAARRAVPQQGRAEQTVEALLDGFAAVVHERGFEGATTAAVAEASGVSIGLVYRYFPNRLAIAEALVLRNRERFFARLLEGLDRPGVVTWRDGLAELIDTFIELHSSEPGFSTVGFADEFLRNHGVESDLDNAGLARGFVAIYHERFARPEVVLDDDDLALHMEVAVEVGNALINRAVARAPGGDPAIIAACRHLLERHLAELLDPPSPPST